MSQVDLVLKRTLSRSSSTSHAMLSIATRRVFLWLRFMCEWYSMKKKSLYVLLQQHRLHVICIAYLVRYHYRKNHSSTLGHGCELVSGRFRPGCHMRLALPIRLHQVKLTKSKNIERENGSSESVRKFQFRSSYLIHSYAN